MEKYKRPRGVAEPAATFHSHEVAVKCQEACIDVENQPEKEALSSLRESFLGSNTTFIHKIKLRQALQQLGGFEPHCLDVSMTPA